MADTPAARRKRQDAIAIEKARVDAARANATAAAAAADAERAKAEAERIRAVTAASMQTAAAAEAERVRKANEAAARRALAEQRRERAYQLGINVGAPIAGMAVGSAFAYGLKKKTISGVRAQATDLKRVAAVATRHMKAAPRSPTAAVRVAGAVDAARRLRLLKPGPAGAVTAGLLLAEGGFARLYLAPMTDNPIAREGLSAVGTASIFAATTLIGKRLVDRRITSTVRHAGHVATMMAATRMVTGGGNILTRIAAGQTLRESIAAGAGLTRGAPIIAATATPRPAPRAARPAAVRMPTAAPTRFTRAAAVAAGVGLAVTGVAMMRLASSDTSARATSAATRAATAATGPAPMLASAPRRIGGLVDVAAHTRMRGGVLQRVQSYSRRAIPFRMS